MQYVQAGDATDADEYLPGVTLPDYLSRMRAYPRFAPVLRTDSSMLAAQDGDGNEFDTDERGRGDSYRIAQRDAEVRLTGIRTLLGYAVGGPLPTEVDPEFRVLDVLGGDGTLARALASVAPGTAGERQWILTGDLSRHMIASALRYRLPAVCQPAQRLMLRDGSFDAVILAYGTHHIPVHERKIAYGEGWRVLKPGGRIVVHDFEEGGHVARWFQAVVHCYTPGGHRYDHFCAADLVAELEAADFRAVRADRMYDPFVVRGETEAAAVANLCSYVFHMYGLFGIRRDPHDTDWQPALWELINRYAHYSPAECPDGVPTTQVRPARDGFLATMPRVSLVCTGTKPMRAAS